MKNQPVH